MTILILAATGCSGSDRQAARDAHFQAARRLTARGARIQEAWMMAVTSDQKSTAVSLRDEQITDADINDVGKLIYVRKVALGPGISDEGFSKLLELQPDIEVLDLQAANLTMTGLIPVSSLKRLKQLHLPKALSPKNAEQLRRQLGMSVTSDGSLAKPR